ncbi:hypothetical protein BDB00DRAFT_826934 [Zychaea mexicana]|uniref:uncharacterized protein n=1 Tax=Zychaea mexicana TaxID=64656 RepID=UPI0022FF327E|nr:uncharacterized protein BDB00DRAFT_826934 [Zychaea mexicana]KAI9492726.1 hypothetical protein BDB00DRAFT_826934 [Zychaea mexicana]
MNYIESATSTIQLYTYYDTSFWIGIGISLITNLIQSFAMAFQRKSHILNDQIYPRERRKHAFKRPLWVVSFGTYLTANIIGSVFSIGYLPVVILAPIGAMNLVFNAIAARLVLGDPFTRLSLWGTLLISIGALLVGMFGAIQEPNHSLEDLIELYRKPAFIVYFSILEAFILITMISTHYLEYRYNKIEQEQEEMAPADRKLLGQWVNMADLKTYIGISYGVLGGNISSQSLLFAKSGLELFILTIIYGQDQLHHVWTWLLVVMTVLTAILQLYYLNKGLRLCDTVILIPLSFCAFNVSCLFNGLVYYDQWDRLQWWQLLCVMVGVAITIGGVICLSWRRGGSAGTTQEETVVASSEGYAVLSQDDNDNVGEEDQDKTRQQEQRNEANETTPFLSQQQAQYNSAS